MSPIYLIVIHPSIHSSYGKGRCPCFGPIIATTGIQLQQRECGEPTGANNRVQGLWKPLAPYLALLFPGT